MTAVSLPERRWGLAFLAVWMSTMIVLSIAAVALGQSDISIGGGAATVVGSVVAWKRPGNRVALALLGFGGAAVLASMTLGYLSTAPAVPSGLDRVIAVVGASVFVLVGAMGCALFLIYPTGHARHRWKWVLRADLALGAVGTLAGIVWALTRPYAEVLESATGDGDSGNPAEMVAAVIFIAVLPLTLASLVARYRAGGVVERRQLRWLLLGVFSLFATSFIFNVTGDFDSAVSKVLTSITFIAFPAAIAIAILRHDLFDIDRILSRTVSYGIVTALLAALFLAVAGAPLLITGTGEAPSWLIAAATLAVAALFTPLRRRVQAVVDRRFDRARYDASRIAGAFTARLRDPRDVESVTADLVATVAATVSPRPVAMWLAGDRTS